MGCCLPCKALKKKMSQNLNKKPSKGILKTTRSVDESDGNHPSTSKRPKEQRFDEMNIMETFHPANKDYGHMKVDEPKTPFSETVDGDLEMHDELDANILAAKLAASMNKPPRVLEHSSSEEDTNETPEERKKRLEFEKRRKSHYNEFKALQLARQLMAQDEEEEEQENKEAASRPKT